MSCYGTLVAVDATVVSDLKEQRAVPEGGASSDTSPAGNAELLDNCIFVVRIFNEGSLNRVCGAQPAFSGRIEIHGALLQMAAAEITVAAHIVGMDTLHRGGR